MNPAVFYFSCLVFHLHWTILVDAAQPGVANLPSYPAARRADTTNTYASEAHGTVNVADPYEWMETDSDETEAFWMAQDNVTMQYFDQCQDADGIRTQLNSLSDYVQLGSPRRIGQPCGDDTLYSYYDKKNASDDWTAYLTTRKQLVAAGQDNFASIDAKKLLDIDDLQGFWFSPSAKVLAYGRSNPAPANGSGWVSVRFLPISGSLLDMAPVAANASISITSGNADDDIDVIYNVRYSDIIWMADDSGVFYQKFDYNTTEGDGLAVGAMLYYHKLGTPQKEDILIADKDPDDPTTVWTSVCTQDGKWLIVNSNAANFAKMRVFVASLDDQPVSAQMKWQSLVSNATNFFNYLTHTDDLFYFWTDNDAPNAKVVRSRVDASKAQTVQRLTDLKDDASFDDHIAEDPEAPIDSVNILDHNKILIWRIKDVRNELIQYELETGNAVGQILPEVMRIYHLRGSEEDDEAYLDTTSLSSPTTVYRLKWDDEGKDSRALPTEHELRTTVINGIDLTGFETEQVFVPSEGGVSVPAYMVYRNDTVLDGTAPGLMLYYGGFDIAFMPYFELNLISWIGMYSGVMIWAGIRGGNEKGTSYWDDGRLLNKKNVLADVIAVAQYAVDNKYVAKGKVITKTYGMGATNSMAVANMDTDGLFGAHLVNQPVCDLLRYALFDVGITWQSEFGNVSDSETFDYVYSYSPLHNVDANLTYPLTLISATKDYGQTPSAHSYKQIAQLQHELQSKNAHPLLLRVLIDQDWGSVNETTLNFCLAAQQLGLERMAVPGGDR